MSIKMIACDLDGTLLDSRKNISVRNRDAIAEFIAAGNKFLIATGRMYISARPYAESLGLNIPLVTYNGALVRSVDSKVILERKMNLKAAQHVLDYCKSKGYYLQYYVGDRLLVEKETEYSRKYAAMQNISVDVVGEKIYYAEEQPYKILVMTAVENFAVSYADFKNELRGVVDVTSSYVNFMELMEPSVNKWEAVKETAGLYGIDAREIMCIGDSDNDLEMVAKAGIGVAVENAVSSVKDVARVITASNDEDGVALIIERIMSEQAKE